MRPLKKVFWEELAEMLHVEGMLLKSLPKMHAAAHAEALKDELENYRTEVQKQEGRVREMFQLFEMPVREKKCDGMMGLLVKGQQMMQRSAPGPALDAGLVSLCRKISGYKVAAYDTLLAWEKLIATEEREGVAALKALLQTETQASGRLAELASECDGPAAEQTVESVRRRSAPAARKPKELAEAPRWGQW